MAHRKQEQREPSAWRKHTYNCYQTYVTAERRYLSEPTPENWEEKEVAFEAYNRALLSQQNGEIH